MNSIITFKLRLLAQLLLTHSGQLDFPLLARVLLGDSGADLAVAVEDHRQHLRCFGQWEKRMGFVEVVALGLEEKRSELP